MVEIWCHDFFNLLSGIPLQVIRLGKCASQGMPTWIEVSHLGGHCPLNSLWCSGFLDHVIILFQLSTHKTIDFRLGTRPLGWIPKWMYEMHTTMQCRNDCSKNRVQPHAYLIFSTQIARQKLQLLCSASPSSLFYNFPLPSHSPFKKRKFLHLSLWKKTASSKTGCKAKRIIKKFACFPMDCSLPSVCLHLSVCLYLTLLFITLLF